MRRRSICLIKCVIGLSVAFIAISNCFNVQSSSSSPTISPADYGTRFIGQKLNQTRASAGVLADATRDRNPVDSLGERDVYGLTGLITRASVLSPFAPVVTATKSHTPSGSAQPGDTLTYSIVITNSGSTDATGVNFTDTIDPNTTLVPSSVKASPIAVNDNYQTIGNVNISVPVAQGVVANDSNSGFGTLSVTKVNATSVPGGGSATASTANGSVTMSSDGSFSYTPNVAFRGPSDSFTYTLDNGSGSTDTATVTIAVNGLIWFVDSSAAPGGDGRLSTPFNCLVGAGCFDPTAADIANDNIFVYSGAYIGGLTLLSGQRLIGQGASQSLLTITGLSTPSGTSLLPSTGGSNPTITSSTNGLNLGSNNQIWGMTFGNKTGAGLSGTGFGTLTVRDTTINGTGQALNLSTGTLDAIFQSLSSTASASTGMTVNAAAGSMSVTGATSVTSATGAGVNLTNNTGTISFNALNITGATQSGLIATDNSNTITTTAGAISTGTGTAVNISRASGTTPLNITLTSVSTIGAVNGIKLVNTSGSFTVAGDNGASNNGSGGTISAATAEGVLINVASNISLGYMIIQNSATKGISATGVNGFTLNRSNVTDLAGGATDEGVKLANTSGTVTFSNDTISGAPHNGVFVDNNNTNMSSFNMTNTTITCPAGGACVPSGSVGNDGLLLQMRGTSVLTSGLVSASIFSGLRATGVQIQTADTARIGSNSAGSIVNSFTVQTSTFTNNGQAIDIDESQVSNLTFQVLNNTNMTGTDGTVINAFTSAGSDTGPASHTFVGKIDGNVIGTQGTKDSGSVFGSGIRVVVQGQNTQGNVTVSNNTIREVVNADIMTFFGQNGAGASGTNAARFKITNNAMPTPSGSNQSFCGPPATPCASNGIFVLADEGTPVCTVITGNSVYDVSTMNGSFDIYLAERTGPPAGAQLTVEGTGGSNSAYIIANNTLAGASDFFDESGTTSQVGIGSCGVFPMSIPQQVEIMSAPNAQSDGQAGEVPTAGDALTLVRTQQRFEEQARRLSPAELNWMVEAAIARWQQAGASAEDLARLRGVSFEFAGLPAHQLANANGMHIKIDETAAGYGWFFDQTPLEDSEFDVEVLGKERQTSDISPAHGRVDLLTVLVRELGSVYLQGKDRIPKRLRPLMETTLAPAVRRMPEFNIPDRSTSSVTPSTGQSVTARLSAPAPSPSKNAVVAPTPAVFNPSEDLMPGSYGRNAKRMSYAANARRVASFVAAPFSGETVNLNIGTIPAGKSVTIMFQVTVDNPFPNGVCNVTNQGHVTGSNFSQVDTNSDVTPINKAVTIGACPANITTNTDAGVCTAVVTFSTPTGDGCPTPTVTCSPASGTAFAKGTTTVTCTATNGNPPDATCTFTVTVNDAQPPTITCPANVTQGTDAGQCTAVVTYANATATDNCPGVGTPVCTPASGSTFNKGTTTVSCTVSDASSNSANCSFTVTVNDTTPPVITCPANVTKSTDPNQCTAVVTYTNATATDNCPGVGTPVCSPSSGSTFVKGVTTVTCTVSDSSGNSANCSFTVTVRDTQAPTLSPCPSNISVTSSGGCQVVNYTPPTATDNCGTATVVCSPASGFCFPPGTTTVTCTASDNSPDSPDTSCSFTVTVVPCAITCPSNISVSNDPGQCGAVVTYAPATNGGCGTIVCTPSSGSFFPVGTTTVICTTTAGPGCSFTVTVADTEPPVITCPPNVNVSASSFPQCTATVNPGTATATDNCGVASVVGTRSDGHALTDPYPPGTTTITWTATDTSGHTASCTQTVTVTNDVSIASNFNGTAVGAANYIWFNSVLDVTGLGSSPVTIRFFNQTVTSASFTLTVPDAVVTFDPLATTATTTFSGGQWVTRVPSSGLAGNTFLSGLAYQLPGNLPGGLNPVTWSGTFVSDTAGVQVKWKWAAAAYSNFSTNYNLLGVKPVDDNHASQYQNSDHAGTPENFKAYVIGGARGSGGSNYTGGYSGTKSVTPCVE